eukprot:2409276-Rhodomonas_salina.2
MPGGWAERRSWMTLSGALPEHAKCSGRQPEGGGGAGVSARSARMQDERGDDQRTNRTGYAAVAVEEGRGRIGLPKSSAASHAWGYASRTADIESRCDA